MATRQWTAADMLQLGSSYQSACLLAAAADLELMAAFAGQRRKAAELAGKLAVDVRGLTTLLDALVAIELLEKSGHDYAVPPSVEALLTDKRPGNVLAMAQHQANCLRRWDHLAEVIKTGKPAARAPSIRGEAADYASFIEAMDNVSAPNAGPVVADIQPQPFRHLLDVGGGSGSWTIAFLKANPAGTATIFDLPQVMPQAEARLRAAGLIERVKLAGGDYMKDPLPEGADLAWVSAIVHSLSREQNRQLFGSVHQALMPGGRILLRDILMDQLRTIPTAGALFAINMLVGTAGGGTYTFEELREDLQAAGFVDAKVLRKHVAMDSVVGARKHL